MKKLLIFMLALTVVASLCSCDLSRLPFDIPGVTDETPDETPDEGKDDEGSKLEGLVLIEDGKAKFNIVYSKGTGAAVIKSLDDFVKRLRSLGVEVADPVAESKAADSECEILVGANISIRGDECCVSDKYLGAKGYAIKTVGNRVVIAGGNDDMTKKAFDLFVKNYMRITDKTKDLGAGVALKDAINDEKLTEYLIKSISIGGNDLRDYTIVTDIEALGDHSADSLIGFAERLYAESGYWLKTVIAESFDGNGKYISVKYTPGTIEGDSNGDGFVAKVIEGNLYIECSYANALDGAFAYFAEKEIFSKMGEIAITEGYYDTYPVSTVRYEYFGAKGDGVADDFPAMLAAHKFANEGGQKVVSSSDKTYYVGASFTETIYAKYNVDLGGAKIIIDDRSSSAFANRKLNLFTIPRYETSTVLDEAAIDGILGTDPLDIKVGDTELLWLAPYVKEKSFVCMTNSKHKDFVRYGSNTDNGVDRLDIFIIDTNGKLDETTPLAFDFDEITRIEIWTVTEEELVFENAEIHNICCKTVAETQFKNAYQAYARGIGIRRSNVVIRNLTHRMIDEPKINYESTLDDLCPKYGERRESYPYAGTLNLSYANNVLIENCSLAAHTLYYEEKAGIADSQLGPTDAVGMGSYGYSTNLCNDLRFINVEQYAPTGLADSKYWGIMNGNTTKNFLFKDCEVNRFDAHRGFWNADLIDTTFGHTINVTGGGYLNMVNVTKITGDDMIFLRGDYGSSFDGDVYMTNCTLQAYTTYNSDKGQMLNTSYSYPVSTVIQTQYQATEHYKNWDFGYPCSLPHNVVLDNFVCGSAAVYVFSQLDDLAFEDVYSFKYEPTHNITFKNMDPFPNVENDYAFNYLREIPVTVINNDSESKNED